MLTSLVYLPTQKTCVENEKFWAITSRFLRRFFESEGRRGRSAWPSGNPVGVIERNRPHPPAPFGWAEFKLPSIYPVTFRPSERRTVIGGRDYKHCTPTEWRLAALEA